MNSKIKYFLMFSAVAICIVVCIFAVKFISVGNIRSQLPEYPDFKLVSASLKKQVLSAGRKTYLNPSAENLGRLGMIYYSGTYYEKAGKCFQLAVKKNSNEWQWSYYLGYLNLEQGELKESIESFARVNKLDSNNYLALYYTGEAFQNLGQNDYAERIFEKISRLNDIDSQNVNTVRENYFSLITYAKFRLARIYINSNRIDSAEILIRDIIDNQYNFGPAFRLLGNIYNLRGDSSSGKKYTDRASDLFEYTPPADILIDKIALMSRSDSYILRKIDDAIYTGNLNLAFQLCNQAVKYNSDNKHVISKAISTFFLVGQDKLAFSYLDTHFRYFSDDFDELISMAEILFKKGNTSRAMMYLNQAKILEPGNSRLAFLLFNAGKSNEAILLLNGQLEKDPENIILLADAVKLILRMGNREMATIYLKKLEQLAPLNVEVFKLKGIIAEQEGKSKESLSLYADAYRMNPDDKEVIRYLAEIYIREEMWENAREHFRLALKTYPNDPLLQEGLAKLLIFCPVGEFVNVEEGREFSERAYTNYQSNNSIKISASRLLATAYAILGDKKRAVEYINVTLGLAGKGSNQAEYIQYFDALKEQYNLSE